MDHIVSESVIETDPAKVERVCDWPVPENAYDVEVLRTLQLLWALHS